ncbi:MAG TPA: molybdenum ABC transporter ATP-binding protein [Steroidobacteraceae bacterium]|jgi:molybdate transport system ATP-binding protein
MLKVEVLKRRAGFTLKARFEAPTPGIVALFGRSGSGKTTTINILAGLLAPDEGRVELEGSVLEDTRAGIHIAPEQRRIGYVFQESRLFPHFSVLGNLQYGQKRAAAATHSIGFDRVVSLLGLERLLRRRPHQLSGGERQRVSLGRALLSQPRLLLLDEPLASLDAARREEVLPYLELLRDNLSLPMVYVSHQFDEVLRLATHLVLMDAGAVTAQGTLHEVSLLPELRTLVGSDAVGAVVDGRVVGTEVAPGMAELQVGRGILHVSVQAAAPGTRVRVHLLARDIILGTQPPKGLSVRNVLEGVIVGIAPDDQEAMLVKVDVGGPVVLSRVTREAVEELALREGLRIWVLVKAVSTRGHAFRLSGASGGS